MITTMNKFPDPPKPSLKVWSLYLEDNTTGRLLHQCQAYELEEAIQNAWDFLKQNWPTIEPRNYLPKMWLSTPVTELGHLPKHAVTLAVSPQVPEVQTEVNKLMEKIIKEKNRKLFRESIKKFNEQEIKYIKDKLKNKS